jgi:hypothetical protein
MGPQSGSTAVALNIANRKFALMILRLPILIIASLLPGAAFGAPAPAALRSADADSIVCVGTTHWFPERRYSVSCLPAERYRRLREEARATALAARRSADDHDSARRAWEARARRQRYERDQAERRREEGRARARDEAARWEQERAARRRSGR